MSNEILIELIRVLPGVLWVGFALVVAFVARSLLKPQLGRMTRVETPVVSVDFAAELLDEAAAKAADVVIHQPPQQWGHARPDASSWEPSGPGPVPQQSLPFPGEPVEPVGQDAGGPAAPDLGSIAEPRSPDWDRFVDGRLPAYGVPVNHSGRRDVTVRDGTFWSVDNGHSTAARLSASTATLTGKRILWVDDNPGNNVELVRLLRSAGADVDVTVSTEAALRVLTPRSHDLVISDMKRPDEGIDDGAGWHLVDRMRDRDIDVPVIVYTFGGDGRRIHGVFGVTDNPYELIHLVMDVMERRRYATRR